MTNWQTWEATLPEKVEVPRSIIEHQEEISSINLHAIGDASSKGGVCCNLSTIRHITRSPGCEEWINNTEAKTGSWAHGNKSVAQRETGPSGICDLASVHCWFYSSVALHWIKGVVYTSSLSVIKCRKSKTRNTSNGTMWV